MPGKVRRGCGLAWRPTRCSEAAPSVVALPNGSGDCGSASHLLRLFPEGKGELSGVGAKRDPPWLARFMKDPKALDPKAKMPAFKGTDEELEALVTYLASLK